jgi:hypothetical protein
MMADITMTRLLQNPTGPYSAYFARRDLTIRNLNERYMKLMQDKEKEFKLERFKDKNDYYFYFKIPSETHENLHYDVVLQFKPIGAQSINDMTLNNYSVKLFSNSPNFVFTYAYVYNNDGILIDFLKEKISKKALTEPPNIKNPVHSYGFEKSVYFALLYIKNHRLNIKSAFDWSKASKLDKKALLKAVDDSEEKLRQNNRAKANANLKKEDRKNQKTVAKSQETGYNKKVERGNGKALKRVETKRNMKKDMSLRKSKPATKRVEAKRNMKKK